MAIERRSQVAELAAALRGIFTESEAKTQELGADLLRLKGKQQADTEKVFAKLFRQQEQDQAKAQQSQGQAPTFIPPQNPISPEQAVNAGAGADPLGIQQAVEGGRGVQVAQQGQGVPSDLTTRVQETTTQPELFGLFGAHSTRTTNRTITQPNVMTPFEAGKLRLEQAAATEREELDRTRFVQDAFMNFVNILGPENSPIAAQAAAAALKGDMDTVHKLLQSSPPSKSEDRAARLLEAEIRAANNLADLRSAEAAKARRETEILGGDPNVFFASDLAGLSSIGPDGKRIKLDPTELRQAVKEGRTSLIALQIGSIFDSGKVPIIDEGFGFGNAELRFKRLQDVMSDFQIVTFGEPGSAEHRAARNRLRDTGLFTLNKEGGVTPLQDDSVNSMTAHGLERLFRTTHGEGREVPSGTAAPEEASPRAPKSNQVEQEIAEIDKLIPSSGGLGVPQGDLDIETRMKLIRRRNELRQQLKVIRAKEQVEAEQERKSAARQRAQEILSGNQPNR